MSARLCPEAADDQALDSKLREDGQDSSGIELVNWHAVGLM